MASRGTRTIIASTSRGLISRRQASTSAGPSSSSTTANDSDVLPLPAPPKPPLKSWFTGRPSLTSFISELSSTLQETRSTLFRSGYLTSVSQDIRTIPRAFAKDATAASSSAKWKGSDDLASELRVAKVRLAYYRRITSLLAELHALQPMLRIEPTLAAHHTRVAELLRRCRKTDAQELTVAAALVDSQQEIFEPPMTQAETERQKARLGGLAANDPAALALIQKERRKRSYGYHDVGLTGIAYGGGRKKTASAQAWLVPVAHSVTPEEESSSSDRIGKVLVNALPISTYFPTAAERSVLLRPFSLTETTGRYNVFVLVQGGGMSSKATAASVACARALAAITDEQTGQEINRAILSKADLLRRDPRVVERKKTGQPKARKRFTWVKR